MKKYKHNVFNKFIEDMHVHFAKGLPEVKHWEGVRPILKCLILDQEFINTS